MSTTPSTWVGWWRAGPSAPWERVAEAAEIGECHRQLLIEQARHGEGRCQDRIITGGGYPVEAKTEL
jgi:hypothetical protein